MNKETEIKMLLEMKTAGIPKQAVVSMARTQNIPEEEGNQILECGQELKQ